MCRQYRQYWGRIARLAFQEVASLVGWPRWPQIVVRSTIWVLSIFAIAVVVGAGAGANRLTAALIGLGAVAGIALLLFLVKLTAVPAKLNHQASEYAAGLESRLARRAASETEISELQARYGDGTALIARGAKPDPGGWRQEVIKWCESIEQKLDEMGAENEAWMFRTVTPLPTNRTRFCTHKGDSPLGSVVIQASKLWELEDETSSRSL